MSEVSEYHRARVRRKLQGMVEMNRQGRLIEALECMTEEHLRLLLKEIQKAKLEVLSPFEDEVVEMVETAWTGKKEHYVNKSKI